MKRTVLIGVLVLLVVIGGGAWYAASRGGDAKPTATAKPRSTPPPPTPSATPAPPPKKDNPCNSGGGAFAPQEVAIKGIGAHVPVLPLHRDANGVPGTAPLDSAGKWEFAWDLDQHVLAGQQRGNTLFNAHTWPDGSALGNALLSHLQQGDTIVVRGAGGQRCYTVTKRYQVAADAKVPDFFVADGPPRLALSVCSGQRLGPGDWTERTVWMAKLSA